MKKYIVGAVISALASVGVAKAQSKMEEQMEKREKIQLERERLEMQQQDAIRKEQAEAREKALDRQMLERENEKNRKMTELNAIRQARAENPIDLTCPRCAGTRIIERMNGILRCPYCRGVEPLNPAHKYREELDGVRKKSPPNVPNVNQKVAAKPAVQQSKNKSVSEWDVALITIFCIIGFCCCCFPLPVTYITARSKKLSPKYKAIIITATWIVYLIIGLFFYVTGDVSQTDETSKVAKINMPFSSSNLMDYNYDYAVEKLEEAGFTNVSAVPMGDLVTGWLTRENSIDRIEVDGDSYFSTSSRFYADADVVVFYHSFPEKETDVAETETSTSAEEDSEKIQKNGFDSSTNQVVEFSSYTIEIPSYWVYDETNTEVKRYYAETGGKVIMLQINAAYDDDEDYPVTFDGLISDNEDMIKALESSSYAKVEKNSVYDTGVVKGVLYEGISNYDSDEITINLKTFSFPDEKERNWCNINFGQSDNAEYLYDEDFMKMLDSIKVK